MKKENVNIKGKSYYQGLKSKYLNLAKEASASGDRILSEHNLQFAEHYGRIINERFSQPQTSLKPHNQAETPKPEIQDTKPLKEVILENKARCVQKKPVKKEQTPNKVETVF